MIFRLLTNLYWSLAFSQAIFANPVPDVELPNQFDSGTQLRIYWTGNDGLARLELFRDPFAPEPTSMLLRKNLIAGPLALFGGSQLKLLALGAARWGGAKSPETSQIPNLPKNVKWIQTAAMADGNIILTADGVRVILINGNVSPAMKTNFRVVGYETFGGTRAGLSNPSMLKAHVFLGERQVGAGHVDAEMAILDEHGRLWAYQKNLKYPVWEMDKVRFSQDERGKAWIRKQLTENPDDLRVPGWREVLTLRRDTFGFDEYLLRYDEPTQTITVRRQFSNDRDRPLDAQSAEFSMKVNAQPVATQQFTRTESYNAADRPSERGSQNQDLPDDGDFFGSGVSNGTPPCEKYLVFHPKNRGITNGPLWTPDLN